MSILIPELIVNGICYKPVIANELNVDTSNHSPPLEDELSETEEDTDDTIISLDNDEPPKERVTTVRPKLERVNMEIVDDNTRKYTYKQKYVKQTASGPVERERLLTRIYRKKTPTIKSRLSATESVIKKLKQKQYTSTQKAYEDYVSAMNDQYKDVKPYGYSTFAAKWNAST